MSKPPIIVDGGISGGVNYRTGLEEWTVQWWAQTISEARTVGDFVFQGVPIITRDIQGREGADGYDITLEYEGLESESEIEPQYSLTVHVTKEKIETFPKIKELVEKWGGTIDAKGKVTFPLDPPQNEVDGNGLTGFQLLIGEGEQTEQNPAFGLTDWLIVGAQFNEKFVRRRVPDDLFEQIGKITTRLPGGFPTPKNKDWMFTSPSAIPRGNAYEITRSRILSKEGGHSRVIREVIR